MYHQQPSGGYQRRAPIPVRLRRYDPSIISPPLPLVRRSSSVASYRDPKAGLLDSPRRLSNARPDNYLLQPKAIHPPAAHRIGKHRLAQFDALLTRHGGGGLGGCVNQSINKLFSYHSYAPQSPYRRGMADDVPVPVVVDSCRHDEGHHHGDIHCIYDVRADVLKKHDRRQFDVEEKELRTLARSSASAFDVVRRQQGSTNVDDRASSSGGSSNISPSRPISMASHYQSIISPSQSINDNRRQSIVSPYQSIDIGSFSPPLPVHKSVKQVDPPRPPIRSVYRTYGENEKETQQVNMHFLPDTPPAMDERRRPGAILDSPLISMRPTFGRHQSVASLSTSQMSPLTHVLREADLQAIREKKSPRSAPLPKLPKSHSSCVIAVEAANIMSPPTPIVHTTVLQIGDDNEDVIRQETAETNVPSRYPRPHLSVKTNLHSPSTSAVSSPYAIQRVQSASHLSPRSPNGRKVSVTVSPNILQLSGGFTNPPSSSIQKSASLAFIRPEHLDSCTCPAHEEPSTWRSERMKKRYSIREAVLEQPHSRTPSPTTRHQIDATIPPGHVDISVCRHVPDHIYSDGDVEVDGNDGDHDAFEHYTRAPRKQAATVSFARLLRRFGGVEAERRATRRSVRRNALTVYEQKPNTTFSHTLTEPCTAVDELARRQRTIVREVVQIDDSTHQRLAVNQSTINELTADEDAHLHHRLQERRRSTRRHTTAIFPESPAARRRYHNDVSPTVHHRHDSQARRDGGQNGQLAATHLTTLRLMQGEYGKRDENVKIETIDDLVFGDTFCATSCALVVEATKSDEPTHKFTVVISPSTSQVQSNYNGLTPCTTFTSSSLPATVIDNAGMFENSDDVEFAVYSGRLNILPFKSWITQTIQQHYKNPDAHELDVCRLGEQILLYIRGHGGDARVTPSFEECLIVSQPNVSPSLLILPSHHATLTSCLAVQTFIVSCLHGDFAGYADIGLRSTYSRCLQEVCDVLHAERETSLSKALYMIQYVVYCGPSMRLPDVLSTQQWLDMERASLVHSLVANLVHHKQPNAEHRRRLTFLLNANAGSITEACASFTNAW